MRPLKQLFIFILAFSAFACGNNKENTKTKPITKKAMLIEGSNNYKDNASTTINSAEIIGNNMTLEVSYSGGCEEHDFSLMGSKLVAKSLPAKRGIFLYHKNNGDSCRELKTETLVFDITDFAYPNSEIILILDGYKGQLSYTLK